jgi:predicted ribosomally synthesized peptide with nif11-like leader
MSLKNVELFYERLSVDADFNTQIQSVENKESCSRIVKAEGYDFTQQEFEEYTSQILEENSELRSVDERELQAVVGGISKVIGWPGFHPLPLYGVVPPKDRLID